MSISTNMFLAAESLPKVVGARVLGTSLRQFGNMREVHNQEKLTQHFNLKRRPLWLNQVHGSTVVIAEEVPEDFEPSADAAITLTRQYPLAVRTADCLPILIGSNHPQAGYAAIHAGWRSLAAGIVGKTIDLLCERTKLEAYHYWAWFGPAIGVKHFEVGSEVYDIFVKNLKPTGHNWFILNKESNKYNLDLKKIAATELFKHGFKLDRIFDSCYCTVTNHEECFSYRRHIKMPGNDSRAVPTMASIISN